MSKIPRTGADLVQAISLAEQHFPSGHAVDDYRLVGAERLLAGGPGCSGNRCWRLTFKLARLVPASMPARVGAGGEIFLVADVEAGRVEVTGFGE